MSHLIRENGPNIQSNQRKCEFDYCRIRKESWVSYLINDEFSIHVGFSVNSSIVLNAVNETNLFLQGLPESLFRSIDFKTTGSVIGAIFSDKLATNIPNAMVNPIEKGHPDIIPASAVTASEESLRNYPEGLEIKGTIGNIRQGANLRAGKKRISELTGITWQAHHREVHQLMGFLWDFNNNNNGFLFPMLVGVFFSDNLTPDDWGEISGTTGRNTKVCGMLKSGKEKMGKGWIALLNQEDYLRKLGSYLFLSHSAK